MMQTIRIEILKVHIGQHVEQKAFDGRVSHRGFPACADCRWEASGEAARREWCARFLGAAMHLDVAEAPWSVAEWAVAPRFDHPRATVLVLVPG